MAAASSLLVLATTKIVDEDDDDDDDSSSVAVRVGSSGYLPTVLYSARMEKRLPSIRLVE